MLGAWVEKLADNTPALKLASELALIVGAFTLKLADKAPGVTCALAEIAGDCAENVALCTAIVCCESALILGVCVLNVADCTAGNTSALDPAATPGACSLKDAVKTGAEKVAFTVAVTVGA